MVLKKRNEKDDKTFLEVKTELFGTNNPDAKSSAEYHVRDLDKVADILMSAVNSNTYIKIISDYDADGACSGSELKLLLKELGEESGYSNFSVRPPHRFSEGYGLSESLIQETVKEPMGLCILVDNGITAVEQVQELIDYGWSVVIIDHHLRRKDGVLPNAEVIIDPMAIEGQADFPNYCASGLVYKLAEYMNVSDNMLKKIKALAAIGTCADSVPLVDEETKTFDNFLILKDGLNLLASMEGRTAGLHALLEAMGIGEKKLTETDIAFGIAPVLNAAGRLYNEGPDWVTDLLTSDDVDKSKNIAVHLVAINNERKELQRKIRETVFAEIDKNGIDKNVYVKYIEGVPEGVIGLVAGDICNKYAVSTIILSDTETKGILKGSGRSYGEMHMKDLLDKNEKYLLAYGGHKSAGGLSLQADNLDVFIESVRSMAGRYEKPEEISWYDYEIGEKDFDEVYRECEIFAPYGEGNPKPVFCLTDFVSTALSGSNISYRVMGASENVVKIAGKEMNAICFNKECTKQIVNELTERQNTVGLHIRLVGDLSINEFRGKKEKQLVFGGYEIMPETKKRKSQYTREEL